MVSFLKKLLALNSYTHFQSQYLASVGLQVLQIGTLAGLAQTEDGRAHSEFCSVLKYDLL